MKQLLNSNANVANANVLTANVLRASNSACLRARLGFASSSRSVAPVAGNLEAVVRSAAVANARIATPAVAAAGAKAISAVSYMPQTCTDMASKFHGKKVWRWRPLCRSGVRFG